MKLWHLFAGLGLASLLVNLGLAVVLSDTLGELKETGQNLKLERERKNTVVVTAQKCSDGVDALATAGEKQAKAGATARKSADAIAQTHNKKADEQLAAPAAVPGDDAASARARIDQWLKQKEGGTHEVPQEAR